MGFKPVVIFVWDQLSGGRPDQSLPPELGGEVDPGYGVEAPVDPGYGLPAGPGRPTHPIARPPVRPDQSLPPIPVLPDQSLPPGAAPKPALPLPALPQGAFLVLWVPGKGYVAVQVGPKPDNTLPAEPGTPDQGLPPQPDSPTAAPAGRFPRTK